jgi:ribosome-associated toxin RatA of RatAB toxin-antitoxin module
MKLVCTPISAIFLLQLSAVLAALFTMHCHPSGITNSVPQTVYRLVNAINSYKRPWISKANPHQYRDNRSLTKDLKTSFVRLYKCFY